MLSSVENRHSTDGRINNVPSSPFLVATLIIYEDKNALTDLLLWNVGRCNFYLESCCNFFSEETVKNNYLKCKD